MSISYLAALFRITAERDSLRQEVDELRLEVLATSSVLGPSKDNPLIAERDSLRQELDGERFNTDVLMSENERLREALSHDREVCGREDNLCWKCRALTPEEPR